MADMEVQGPNPDWLRKAWERKVWITGGSIVGAVVVIVVLAALGRGFTIERDAEGALSLNVLGVERPLVEVLTKAKEDQPAAFAALVRDMGYYDIKSEDLVAELGRIDVAEQDYDEVTKGLRRLLWDMEGPFTKPGTLSGADARLIEAVSELGEVDGSGEMSPFLAGLVRLSLDRHEVFRLAHLRAEIVPMPIDAAEGEVAVVYACPPAFLRGKGVALLVDGLQTGAIAHREHHALVCDGVELKLERFLGGAPVRLGLAEDRLAALGVPAGTEVGIRLYQAGTIPQKEP